MIKFGDQVFPSTFMDNPKNNRTSVFFAFYSVCPASIGNIPAFSCKWGSFPCTIARKDATGFRSGDFFGGDRAHFLRRISAVRFEISVRLSKKTECDSVLAYIFRISRRNSIFFSFYSCKPTTTRQFRNYPNGSKRTLSRT